MTTKLFLTGRTDCLDFCSVANSVKGDVILKTADGKYSVNGKSIVGCLLASSEWGDDVWLVTDSDNYFKFEPWIEVAADDGAYIHE